MICVDTHSHNVYKYWNIKMIDKHDFSKGYATDSTRPPENFFTHGSTTLEASKIPPICFKNVGEMFDLLLFFSMAGNLTAARRLDCFKGNNKKLDPQAEKRWTPIQKCICQEEQHPFQSSKNHKDISAAEVRSECKLTPIWRNELPSPKHTPWKSTWSIKMMLWRRNFNCEIFTSPF